MKELTYEEVYKEWGNSSYKRINYRDKVGWIRIRKRDKDKKVIYFVELEWYGKGDYFPRRTSIESVHYDKVVSRFQRFVDEYCTDWQARASFQYKRYRVFINQERDKEFYIGYVSFHKNSTYKHIADTREEVEGYCKNRIDRAIYEKEKVKGVVTKELFGSYKGYELEITYEPTMKYPYLEEKPYVGRVHELLLSWRGKTPEDVKKEFREYFDKKGISRVVKEKTKQIRMLTPKQEKIQELEQLQARISAQLEELKKEKDTLTYKGVVLEYGYEEGLQEGYMVGRIKNAPEGTKEFYRKVASNMRVDFEEYIDELEAQYNLYRTLTGREE